jgi:prophage maintenance system killer protein
LNGETVLYASAINLKETLDYDFQQEKQFSYKGLSLIETVEHLIGFFSGIWQIHPFGEGNTRTTAVFAIKYLRTFGFDVNNILFEQNSWYFRNALVRANYMDIAKNIYATKSYLRLFFGNLLLKESHTLKNRTMHIDFQSAKTEDSKSNICTLEEQFVLKFLKDNPKATQKEIALQIKKSERTAKTITSNLQQKKLLERHNGKRNGFWVSKISQEFE